MSKDNWARAQSLVSDGKISEALALYESMLEMEGTSIELLSALITTHDRVQAEWSESDFAKHMDWVMQKKELEDPTFKRIHARSLPESREIQGLIKRLLAAKSTAQETEFVEKICEYGEAALYPLIDSLISFKSILPRLQEFMNQKNQDETE